jgi:hypothetical protein
MQQQQSDQTDLRKVKQYQSTGQKVFDAARKFLFSHHHHRRQSNDLDFLSSLSAAKTSGLLMSRANARGSKLIAPTIASLLFSPPPESAESNYDEFEIEMHAIQRQRAAIERLKNLTNCEFVMRMNVCLSVYTDCTAYILRSRSGYSERARSSLAQFHLRSLADRFNVYTRAYYSVALSL